MKIKGSLLIALCVICSLLFCAISAQNYINYSYPDLLESSPNKAAEKPIVSGEKNKESSAEIKVSASKPQITDNKSTSKAIEVSGESVLGKIEERFLSPYSSNTSYGKIHIKNNTTAKVDFEGIYKQKIKFAIEKNEKPQVLIVHTHTTESYMSENRDYYTALDKERSRDKTKNMIAIGDIFTQKLISAGIGVIHDTTIHDDPAYSGSYDRAKETILKNLKKYPTIKIVLDIHRDSISGSGSSKIKPITDINGKKYAQVMLVMGSQTGDIKNFPNWKENLSLALKYQQNMEVLYPSLARALTFNSAKYNENITTGSLLLEVGSEANTLDEAKLSAEAAANALVSLLNTLQNE